MPAASVLPPILQPQPSPPRGAPPAARALAALLRGLGPGVLELTWPDGNVTRFGRGGGGTAARITLADWRVCAEVLARGDIGFAEAYLEGRWTTPDLAALLTLLAGHRDVLHTALHGTWRGRLLYRLRHWLNRNSRTGSRRNIQAHYDLGNAFYHLWLDRTMSYSSALFEGDFTRDTEQAQAAKLRRALAACALPQGGRLLEIGCGWGALAEAAAREHGARVTGVTLSRAQLAWARQRLGAAGLEADLRLQDYRDIDDGPYDAIVSIEMFEAVGRAYWPSFFDALRRNLRPGGHACIQTITIRDDLFDDYVRGTDFIQQYIFPGGLLPSAAMFKAQAEAAGFQVLDALPFGADYAETLRRWRSAFTARESAVHALGFDGRFVRLWHFYLAYCEAGFASGSTNVWQFTLRRS